MEVWRRASARLGTSTPAMLSPSRCTHASQAAPSVSCGSIDQRLAVREDDGVLGLSGQGLGWARTSACTRRGCMAQGRAVLAMSPAL